MKKFQFTILFLATIFSFGLVRGQSTENSTAGIIRAKALNNEAVKKSDAGNFAEAIELFQKAIVLCPDYAVAYGNLGATLYLAGRFEEAVVVLKKAIQLKPEFAAAYRKLGVIYNDLGKYDEAVESLTQAIKSEPDSALAHYNLGCVYIRQQKFKEAVSSFERAAELNPNFAEIYVQSGFALSRLKKYGEAIRQMEKAAGLQPNDAEARFFLGQLYLLNRDKQSALAQHRKIVLLDADLAKKLYAVIYGKMIVTVSEK